jgi:small-conductance mechanosensitive channel
MTKHHISRSIRRFVKSFIIFLILIGIIGFFLSPYGATYATGFSVFSAAVVFALQNYVASFFSYLYITVSRQFERGDIINTGNPFMSAKGEVRKIGFFFITIKEVDDELLFTGKYVSIPNNLIFSGGIFNYTKNNLLFWHEFTIVLWSNVHAYEEFLEAKQVILEEYYASLTDTKYYPDSTLIHQPTNRPKFDLRITDKWLECKVRFLVHFYQVLNTNNLIMCSLIDAHKVGKIKLIDHKDYHWLDTVHKHPTQLEG